MGSNFCGKLGIRVLIYSSSLCYIHVEFQTQRNAVDMQHRLFTSLFTVDCLCLCPWSSCLYSYSKYLATTYPFVFQDS